MSILVLMGAALLLAIFTHTVVQIIHHASLFDNLINAMETSSRFIPRMLSCRQCLAGWVSLWASIGTGPALLSAVDLYQLTAQIILLWLLAWGGAVSWRFNTEESNGTE